MIKFNNFRYINIELLFFICQQNVSLEFCLTTFYKVFIYCKKRGAAKKPEARSLFDDNCFIKLNFKVKFRYQQSLEKHASIFRLLQDSVLMVKCTYSLVSICFHTLCSKFLFCLSFKIVTKV